MKPSWTLRQVLALLRGIALMVALFWTLILLQLVPALVRGGREHIARVAVAGVPPEHWDIAISRMYLALGITFAIGILSFLAQRYLGRRLASQGRIPRRA